MTNDCVVRRRFLDLREKKIFKEGGGPKIALFQRPAEWYELGVTCERCSDTASLEEGLHHPFSECVRNR